MSIQDPSQTPYGQQPYGTPSSNPGYQPVSDASAQDPSGGAPPSSGFGAGYTGAPYPNAPIPGAPNPGLAALLGFIPGVGAMYNGQFPKGIAHIAIFAVFSSLSKNVNGIFGLFVAGWIFYMVFEAYQTARARRDGLPLPDPFGLNNIGERFGFRGNPDFSSFWNHHTPPGPVPPVSDVPPVDPATGMPNYGRPAGGPAPYQVDPEGNVYRGAAAPGYPPPASSYPPPASGYPPPASGYAPPASGYAPPVPPPAGYPPYGPPPSAPFGSAAYGTSPYGPPPMPPMPVPHGGLPTGALWLIGLGFFALLGSLRSFAFLEGEATGGLFLIGLSIFLLYRHYSVNRGLFAPGSPAARWNVLRASRGPGVVFVVGLLTLLQGLHVVDWEYSWPLLLIFLGVFILVERFAQNSMAATPYPAGYPVDPQSAPVEPEAETSSSTSILPRYSRPSNDLDQKEGR
ncbi:MAG: hypothetical protein ACRYGF_10035 [Janthinobacterium lividum]